MSTTHAPDLTGTWRADVTHSSIVFAVRHMGISMFRGEVTEFDVVATGGEQIALTGSGRVASIVTRDDTLTAHIGAPDFFDAERHPEIRVESRAVDIDGDAVTVHATLTMKGIARDVVLTGSLAGPVEDPFGGTRIGLSLETTIDRRDFGLDFVLPMPGGGPALGWKVRLGAELELVRES
jgi:polyisoprenoid-binding protein YceI